MNVLSSINRKELIQSLSEERYDLVIIGGGITGAGIALDAASRGLKVALVEKNDFASGTSSRSTKLIHGGLRYLKQLEIALVREVGSERAIVHKLAPHLVIAEKMLLPLIEGGSLGKISTSFALKVYDFLAGVEDKDKRKMLSKEETIALESMLRTDILIGGGIYAEYRTDDARLTIENIKTAAKYGVHSINYLQVNDFIYEDGQVKGVKCLDLNTKQSLDIRAKHVISAAGPWVDELRKTNKSLSSKHLFLSKGVHIVVPRDRFPLEQAVYFDIPDGRMMFTIPRQRVTYIGTTDTPYKEDINHVLTRMEDVEYLLNAVNNMFPDAKLSPNDVVSSWAGLRPLIFEEGKSASELSRKDEIFESETGLLSIAGGKLTGYRKMAERIVNIVCERIEDAENRNLKDNYTEKIELTGGSFIDGDDVLKYTESLSKLIVSFGLESFYAEYLVANYGRQSDQILEKMKTFNDDANIAITRAEVWYCIHHELVLEPLDYFSRRSGRLYFNIDTIPPVLEKVLEDFAHAFDWDTNTLNKHRDIVQTAIHEASTFEYSKEYVQK